MNVTANQGYVYYNTSELVMHVTANPGLFMIILVSS